MPQFLGTEQNVTRAPGVSGAATTSRSSSSGASPVAAAITGLGAVGMHIANIYKDKAFGDDIASAREEIEAAELSGNLVEAKLKRSEITNGLLRKYGASSLGMIQQGLTSGKKTHVVSGGFKHTVDSDGNILHSEVFDPLETQKAKKEATLASFSVNYEKTAALGEKLIDQIMTNQSALDPGIAKSLTNSVSVIEKIPDQIEDVLEKYRAYAGGAESLAGLEDAKNKYKASITNLIYNGLDEFQTEAFGRLVGDRTLPSVDQQYVKEMAMAYISDTMDQLSEQGVFGELGINRSELSANMRNTVNALFEYHDAVHSGDLKNLQAKKTKYDLVFAIEKHDAWQNFKKSNPGASERVLNAPALNELAKLIALNQQLVATGGTLSPRMRATATQMLEYINNMQTQAVQVASQFPQKLQTRQDIIDFRNGLKRSFQSNNLVSLAYAQKYIQTHKDSLLKLAEQHNVQGMKELLEREKEIERTFKRLGTSADDILKGYSIMNDANTVTRGSDPSEDDGINIFSWIGKVMKGLLEDKNRTVPRDEKE